MTEYRTPNHFKPGDRVRRRRGALGNIDGSGREVGVVLNVYELRGHKMVRVSIGGRDEDFVWDTYEKA